MIRLALALALAVFSPALGCGGPAARPMSLLALGDHLAATGQIVPGNAGRFAWLVASEHPRTVVLDSNGGDIGEAMAMAETIRSAGLSVTIGPRAHCASACFLLLAAARESSAATSSSIGVHRAATCDGRDSPIGTEAMAAKAVAFGTPAGIVRRMVSTPQPGIAWLSADELAGMGVRLQ